MGNLTIPDLDETLAASLRERASVHGRTVEEEARAILRDFLAPVSMPDDAEISFGEAMRRAVAEFGPIDIDLPPRERIEDPPDLAP